MRELLDSTKEALGSYGSCGDGNKHLVGGVKGGQGWGRGARWGGQRGQTAAREKKKKKKKTGLIILAEGEAEPGRRKEGMTVRVYFRIPARDDCRVLQARESVAASDSRRLGKARFRGLYLGF